jgi:hypothetical protein
MADTAPKPFVFVLMPFAREFEDAYKLAIRPAVEEAGAYCERLDEQIFTGNILARLYNQIAKADLLVADMTGRNVNVFYEVGYAHALGKTVLLVTRKEEDIPFDLKHYPHIIYGSLLDLKENLHKRVAYHLCEPVPQERVATNRLQFFIDGNLLTSGANIPVMATPGESGVWIELAVHNPEPVPINSSTPTALILPAEFDPPGATGITLPNKRVLYHFRTAGEMLPLAWTSLGQLNVRITPMSGDYQAAADVRVPVELQVFAITGPISTPFTLAIRRDKSQPFRF